MYYKTKFRVKQLKAMHKMILTTSQDGIYNDWIMEGIPDEPREEDFINIAKDDEEYWRVVELFQLLVNERGFYY